MKTTVLARRSPAVSDADATVLPSTDGPVSGPDRLPVQADRHLNAHPWSGRKPRETFMALAAAVSLLVLASFPWQSQADIVITLNTNAVDLANADTHTPDDVCPRPACPAELIRTWTAP